MNMYFPRIALSCTYVLVQTIRNGKGSELKSLLKGAASDLTYSPSLNIVLDLAADPGRLTQQLKVFDQSC